MPAIHYKFKSTPDVRMVDFDGVGLTLAELKREIVAKEALARGPDDFDFRIVNDNSKQEYTDEKEVIPQGTLVTVMRVAAKGPGLGLLQAAFPNAPAVSSNVSHASFESGGDSEAARLRSLQDGPQRSGGPRQRAPPSQVECHACHKRGHLAVNCPDVVRKPVGIPRTFLQATTATSGPGVLRQEDGSYVMARVNDQQWDRQKASRMLTDLEAIVAKPPAELACEICKRLLTNASRAPCCHTPFCDECIRTHLDEHHFECFHCKQPLQPDRVCPDGVLRRTVEQHKQAALAERARELEEAEHAKAAKAVAATVAPIVPEARKLDASMSSTPPAPPRQDEYRPSQAASKLSVSDRNTDSRLRQQVVQSVRPPMMQQQQQHYMMQNPMMWQQMQYGYMTPQQQQFFAMQQQQQQYMMQQQQQQHQPRDDPAKRRRVGD